LDKLIEQYQQGYSQILSELEGLTEEEISFKPSEKSWSIKEIIVHITDAELVHIHRMKAVLSEGNPLLTAFDQDLWTNRLNYQSIDHQLYLQLFQSLRNSFLPILNQISEQDYSRIGTHTEAGPLSFKDILEHSIEHIDTHIAQIRRVKQKYNEQ
jgi:uncharacterized damage-inducible protein DinB